jgi:hypothetical protein
VARSPTNFAIILQTAKRYLQPGRFPRSKEKIFSSQEAFGNDYFVIFVDN